MAFSNSLWAEIRKEFGDHCMRRNDFMKANENYEVSLKHKEDKLDSVSRLAKSQSREANIGDAKKLLEEKKDLSKATFETKQSSKFISSIHRTLPKALRMQSPRVRCQLRSQSIREESFARHRQVSPYPECNC